MARFRQDPLLSQFGQGGPRQNSFQGHNLQFMQPTAVQFAKQDPNAVAAEGQEGQDEGAGILEGIMSIFGGGPEASTLAPQPQASLVQQPSIFGGQGVAPLEGMPIAQPQASLVDNTATINANKALSEDDSKKDLLKLAMSIFGGG